MKLAATPIPGVYVADTERHLDRRGSFARLFCEHQLAKILGDRRIVQINHSQTGAVGAVRGMHYQRPPHAETKMVRCLRGAVWDVAVDLRPSSPSYLCWHAEELRPETARMMIIPEGCAHGFQVLEPASELLYLHTAFYAAEAEGGVRHDDPALAIPWPLPTTEVSDRDTAYPLIGSGFRGIEV